MSWLFQRHAVLSQDIADADPPEDRRQDLRTADFTRPVDRFAGPPGRLQRAQTARGHLEGAAVARIGLAGHGYWRVGRADPHSRP
jgi:flagellar basal body rod protein FlgB